MSIVSKLFNSTHRTSSGSSKAHSPQIRTRTGEAYDINGNNFKVLMFFNRVSPLTAAPFTDLGFCGFGFNSSKARGTLIPKLCGLGLGLRVLGFSVRLMEGTVEA